MAEIDSATAQKLLKSFMQFKKMGWHEKKIAGYNPSEFKVLATIQQGIIEGMSYMKVSEISQKLHVTSPTVTQIINNLEKDGMVERTIDPKDRRAVKIKLTPTGIEATEQAKKVLSESFLGLIDFLGEEDSEKLSELLSKVFHYFNDLNHQ